MCVTQIGSGTEKTWTVKNSGLIFWAIVYLYFKIRSVSLGSHLTLYPSTDCAAATDISGVSGRWQLSR